MDYEIGDEVIFYRSSCERALEFPRRGFIKKVNKKSYVVAWESDDNAHSSFFRLRKELIKELIIPDNYEAVEHFGFVFWNKDNNKVYDRPGRNIIGHIYSHFGNIPDIKLYTD